MKHPRSDHWETQRNLAENAMNCRIVACDELLAEVNRLHRLHQAALSLTTEQSIAEAAKQLDPLHA